MRAAAAAAAGPKRAKTVKRPGSATAQAADRAVAGDGVAEAWDSSVASLQAEPCSCLLV